MPPKHIQILELATALLNAAGLATPIIFAGVAGINAIIKGLTGTGATLAELADTMESQLDMNDVELAADMARYRETLGL